MVIPTQKLDTSISVFQLVDKVREMNALMNTADLAYDAYRTLNVANEARRGLEADSYIGKMAYQALVEYAQSDLCGAEGILRLNLRLEIYIRIP